LAAAADETYTACRSPSSFFLGLGGFPKDGAQMNREMKRMQRRQGADRTAVDRATAATSTRRAASQEKRRRTPPRQFLKEVRQELKKVNWPTRQELVAYTIVVLVSVTVLTSYVFGLDFVFSKVVLNLFGT
jgi:preprotein translocase subunit SecE